jgi:hypothetical protein
MTNRWLITLLLAPVLSPAAMAVEAYSLLQARAAPDLDREAAQQESEGQGYLHAATSSMLTSGYNSTINMMAAMGNMSGTRYRVR